MNGKTESGKWKVVARHFSKDRKMRPEAKISRNAYPTMKPVSKQQGYALLVFATMLATAATALTVKYLNNPGVNTQIARDKITAAALAQSKEALIGYAISYGDTHPGNVHGYLPCPDSSGTAIGGEGASEGSCGAKDVSTIGRLPWKTLDLPPLRGGDNECLWYAVSGNYKNNPQTGLMNWDANGQLQIYASDGTQLTSAENQAVAVIFSPGTAAAGQDRSGATTPVCGGNYAASNYLDAVGSFNNATVSNAAGANSRFRMGDPTTQTGDRLIYITRQDIWNAMQKRNDFASQLDAMTRSTAECIKKYATTNNMAANKSLPWPVQLALSDYTDNTRYNDVNNLLVGRVPYKVNTSRSATLNSITGTSPDIFLLKDDKPSGTAYCQTSSTGLTWAKSYPWWYNWKDHLFYAISDRYKPDNVATIPCSSGHCVSVNGTGNYAAVVIFAGVSLSGQIRSDKSIVSAYLEGRNAGNINGNNPGHGNYQSADAPPSATFDDIVYCIKEDLTVVKGTSSGCP